MTHCSLIGLMVHLYYSWKQGGVFHSPNQLLNLLSMALCSRQSKLILSRKTFNGNKKSVILFSPNFIFYFSCPFGVCNRMQICITKL